MEGQQTFDHPKSSVDTGAAFLQAESDRAGGELLLLDRW
jgi:hypothetical protein